jgi:hypothetical protein
LSSCHNRALFEAFSTDDALIPKGFPACLPNKRASKTSSRLNLPRTTFPATSASALSRRSRD